MVVAILICDACNSLLKAAGFDIGKALAVTTVFMIAKWMFMHTCDICNSFMHVANCMPAVTTPQRQQIELAVLTCDACNSLLESARFDLGKSLAEAEEAV